MTQTALRSSSTHRSVRAWRGHVGAWQLGDLIGEGEWTLVHAARPASGPEERPWDFAVKLLKHDDPLGISLLQREAFVGRQVSHPNLISVFASHAERPPRYVVTPRLEAVMLRDVLVAWQPAASQALWIVRQIAEALQSLHSAGWRHADVKPENVMVAPSGHATLIDLGFCQPLACQLGNDRQAFVGTLQYAAPELFVGHAPIDGAADVYSLGIVLFELLTGAPPFHHDDAEDLAAAHLTAAPSSVRDVRPHLPIQIDWLIQKLLSKHACRRPPIEDVIAALVNLEIETLPLADGGPVP